MYDTFLQGKDLYSEIASKAFKVPYEDCLEFYPDGTTNDAGKERRTASKRILLGLLYGRGIASIAEQLDCSVEKAQEIKDSVFRGFPAIEEFEKASLNMGETDGFVTTVCGRKRRLPALQLSPYEFRWKNGTPPDDDLLNFSNEVDSNMGVPSDLERKYRNQLSRCKFWDKKKIIEKASEVDGVWIVDNGGKIADAQRQCVNARIQGSAADLSKLAMIKVGTNKSLNDLGFRLLIPVHDELIGECPKENMEKCAELLAKTMSDAAQEIIEMPIKCDVAVTERWYGEEIKI